MEAGGHRSLQEARTAIAVAAGVIVMAEQLNLHDLIELSKLKKDNPEEYTQLLKDIESVAGDMAGLVVRLNKKIRAEFEKE